MTGSLDVLSTGRGHLTITVSEDDRAKAKRLITDMLRQGYALFVEPSPGAALVRVQRFDAEHLTYLVDVPDDDAEATETPAEAPDAPVPPRKRKLTPVKATTAKGVAVGRMAGG